MENKRIIHVSGLIKTYNLYKDPIDRLKESLSFSNKKYHQEFFALDDVEFDVYHGEAVGIIGRNGAGKSTLLKIVTGVLTQSSGEVEVQGRISALLELGAGFNLEYSGMENIFLQGTIMGFTRKEMEAKVNDIIEFAEIGEFIDQPVRTYSSGMFVRLAFAIAINVEPDILIIDEALAVGDIEFQQKCYRKIEEFKKEKTIILVSHDMGSIVKFCDRVLWLNEGKVRAFDEPKKVAKQYRAYMVGDEVKRGERPTAIKEVQDEDQQLKSDFAKCETFGDGKAEITGVGLFDTGGCPESIYDINSDIKVVIEGKVDDVNLDYIIGFTINNYHGTLIAQTNTYVLEKEVVLVEGRFHMEFVFTLPNLNEGIYTLSPAVASGTQLEHTQHCWIYDAIDFRVINTRHDKLEGIVSLLDVEVYG